MTPQTREPMSRAEALAAAEKAQRQADAARSGERDADTDPFRAELWQNIATSYRLIARVAEERGDVNAGESDPKL